MVPLAFGLGAAGIAGTTGAIGLKQFLAKKKKKRSAGNALGSPSLTKGLAKRRAKTLSKAAAPAAVASAMGARGVI
tara:strand:- start:56 stop:283 length:228 start_codon:yes stop_codon:yes gene_type:complete